jgi:hypothetical protein
LGPNEADGISCVYVTWSGGVLLVTLSVRDWGHGSRGFPTDLVEFNSTGNVFSKKIWCDILLYISLIYKIYLKLVFYLL